MQGDESGLDKNVYDAEAAFDPQAWTLNPKSTSLIAVSAERRNEQTAGGRYESRRVAAAKQTYRVRSNSADDDGTLATAVWIVDCRSDCHLDDAIPIGLIHGRDVPQYLEQAEIVFPQDVDKYMLVLAGVEGSQLTIRLFSGRLLQSPPRKSMSLTTNATEWPTQLPLTAKLSMTVPSIHSIDYMSVRAIGESLIIKVAEENSEGVTYRYSMRTGKWMIVEFEQCKWEALPPGAPEVRHH